MTYKRVKALFAWPRMKKMIQQWTKDCAICQQAKLDLAKYPGLLQPLPIPEGAWQIVSLDFIEGLPRSEQFNCILVVVDKFSRYAHFIPLSHPFLALDAAVSYMKNIYKLHGMPKVLISDRDKIFTSKLWEFLFTKSGTALHLSTAYHPQSDGQTERVNQCLEMFLRCFTHAAPSKWITWLHLVEYWYNTSIPVSIQPWAKHHLKSSIATNLYSWASHWRHVQFLTWICGYRKELCLNYCSNTSTVSSKR